MDSSIKKTPPDQVVHLSISDTEIISINDSKNNRFSGDTHRNISQFIIFYNVI